MKKSKRIKDISDTIKEFFRQELILLVLIEDAKIDNLKSLTNDAYIKSQIDYFDV